MTSDREIGSTHVADATWNQNHHVARPYERTVPIGVGEEQWRRAVDGLMSWGVKTGSGFEVRRGGVVGSRAMEGVDYTLIASVGPVNIHEPVRVVSVVETPERCGFAYATRPGHPVTGEEAFIVHRTADGRVWFTQRSLTRPGSGPWRLAFPIVLVAQRWYRARYVRAMHRMVADP